MLFRLAADCVFLIHLGFVLFVALGALAVLRWRRLAWLHVPAALWGVGIELAGGICPLTPLENWLRSRAGEAGFSGGFIEQYLVPIVYPAGLTHGAQIALGIAVLLFNGAVYGWIVLRRGAEIGGGN